MTPMPEAACGNQSLSFTRHRSTTMRSKEQKDSRNPAKGPAREKEFRWSRDHAVIMRLIGLLLYCHLERPWALEQRTGIRYACLPVRRKMLEAICSCSYRQQKGTTCWQFQFSGKKHAKLKELKSVFRMSADDFI